jgi:hypothetical protein
MREVGWNGGFEASGADDEAQRVEETPWPLGPAVEAVARDGKADGREVRAELMRAPRLR